MKGYFYISISTKTVAAMTVLFACTSTIAEQDLDLQDSDGGSDVARTARTDGGAKTLEASSEETVPAPPDAGDAGIASNPGKLTCGTTECSTADGSLCCDKTREDGGIACTKTCSGSTDVFRIRCDEGADCPDGKFCCLGAVGMQCSTGPCVKARICKTDAECGADQCLEKTCLGRKVRVCGDAPGCP